MSPILRLLRPKQWTKNLLVFAALLFTAGWNEPEASQRAVWAFVAVCLASSAIYIVNDLIDADADRRHPKKKTRPIANGQVATSTALLLSLILGFGGFTIATFLAKIPGPIAVFLATQLLYTLVLKRIAILDVMAISALFVLRAVIGAYAILAPISPWILMCTATLALMLGFGKRRQELRALGAESRTTLKDYSPTALDAFVWLSAGLSLVSYLLYVVESDTARNHGGLLFTAPFVMFGVLRYLLILSTTDSGEEPETILLADKQVLASVVGFIIVAGLAMTDKISATGVIR